VNESILFLKLEITCFLWSHLYNFQL
jgi:hypothetical protein